MAEIHHLTDHKKLMFHESDGTAGTIIAVHGLTGNHKTFLHYEQGLEESYRFISYDLRGRGDSSPAENQTSIFEHTKDLLLFIKQKGIENPILMGYSMGAYICALAASEIQTKGLILLDGAGITEEKQRDLIVPSLSRLQKKYATKNDYVTQTKTIYEGLHVEWDAIVEEITNYEVHQTANGWQHKSDALVMEKDFNSFYAFKPKEVFLKINCPILLVIALGPLGQKPPLFTKETYEQTIEYAKDIQTIEVHANHYTLMFEKQPYIESKILELLNRIEKVTQ
ncbi:alpha/beta hydrolase [Mammaliicoccus sciuri]|uniref:alpha/beta hydrolase n=1 Tax=Sporosarcina sp. FSL W7-1283 TaxID=2921560 RepID=UPI0030F8C10C